MFTGLLIAVVIFSVVYFLIYRYEKWTLNRNIWKDSILLDGNYSMYEAVNACPQGYRLPTRREYRLLCLETDFRFDEQTQQGVFTFSDGFELRNPIGEYKNSDEQICDSFPCGIYWSSSARGIDGYILYFTQEQVISAILSGSDNKFFVRYIKNR